MNKAKDMKEFVERVDATKKINPKDLSSDQDLTIALMNLISIEEHLIFSGAKTGKTVFYDMVADVRELRKNLMLKVIPAYEGEVWCISKHLLATSMRLMEVGTKQQSMGRNEKANDLFNQAYNLYCLFWGLNMGLIDTNGIKWQVDNPDEVIKKVQALQNTLSVKMKDTSSPENEKKVAIKMKGNEKSQNNSAEEKVLKDNFPASGSMFDKLKAVVKKAVDCCIE